MKRFLLALLVVFASVSPAAADMLVASGVFQADTTKTVGQTFSLTNIGFTPVYGIFWWNGETGTTDHVGSATIRPGVCFATTSSSVSTGSASNHNVSTSSTIVGSRTDDCLSVLQGNGNYIGRASVTMDSGNNGQAIFTVVGTQFSAASSIAYLIFGGSDITNVAIGTDLTGTGTTKSITGLGFQPDTVHIAAAWEKDITSSGTTAPGSWSWGIAAGAAGSPSSFLCGLASQNGVTTPNTRRYCLSGEVIAAGDVSNGSFRIRGPMNSFDLGGFTMGLTVHTSTREFIYLAVKGGKYTVANSTTRTDANDIALSGFGFAPKSVLVLGHGTSASTAGTMQDHAELSMGASIANDAGIVLSVQDQDKSSVSNTNGGIAIDTDKVYVNVSTSGTAEGVMKLTSLGSDGVTFNMTTNDTAANFFGVWSVGPTAGAGGNSPRAMNQYRRRR
jgi:hypothetical protein